MTWGKKKPSSSLINHVFPVSWLSKFKQKKNDNTELQEPGKMKQKGKVNLTSLTSPTNVSLKEGRFYGGDNDDDPYWRLSFTEDRFEAHHQNQQFQNPLWYGSYDEGDQFSICTSKMTNLGEENHKFNDMVSRKIRAKPKKMCNRHNEAEFSNKRNSINDEKLRKLSRKALEERMAENARQPDQQEEEEEERAAEVIEKDIFEIEPENEKVMQRRKEKLTAYNSRKTGSLNIIEESSMIKSLNLKEESDALSEEEFESECLEMKDMKIKEILVKSEYQQRKSVYINQKRRRKHGIKIRANSPRTAAKIECRIKALEDMKKAKMKMRQRTNERLGEDGTFFDSYAVVKSSFDPFRDFRNSMIEMITQRGIKDSDELEELLACYLTLNCDEYHDLIIKVFRQVWFELNLVNIGAELQDCCCSDE